MMCVCSAKVMCSSIQDETSYGRIHDIPGGTSDPPEHHQANSTAGVAMCSVIGVANSFYFDLIFHTQTGYRI